ncbi:MAG: glycoside hydrolase family 2 protein, partial [Prevotellaceae bacterium]|nr:glycoside hydrolase family 2 protein [Prevotellaceae bacterium]
FKIENKNNIFVNKTFDLKKGFNKIEIDFNVKNAKIWWTNGIGEQPLYNFQCSVNEQHTTITTGIRTVEIIRQKDEAGQSMSVRLNGKDIFMKGANWIPLDNFINRVTPEKYEHFIRSAADANMNMLRVWGGGIYENNIFYQLCDSSGILVWQDMMFACGMFPADEKYLQTVENEVIDNVRRLRNHPCIALWNGNNENEISYYQWGWRTNMTPQHDDIYQGNLQKLFYNLIPAAIQSVDPSRYYHPTSPVTGYNKIGYNMGDVHLWSVWKGAEVEDYLKNTGRFMSEYGFQSYPDMFTIKKFSSPRDWTLDSPVMLAHQRAKDDETGDPHFGNRMMSGYMEKYFTVPADFQDFVYMSQFQQAEIVKVAMESHRRSKPYCMGTLFWQLNDCWQAASWASIDYYGRWKALQYYAKKAYADILVSPYYDDNKLKIKVISDLLTNTKANLQVTAMTVNGKIIFDKTIPLNISPNSAEDIFQENLAAIFNDIPENQCFVLTTLKQGDKEISSNIYYHLYANKYLYSNDLPEIKISKNNDGFSIMLISKTLIRGVYLYTENENDVFSDNYFTLIPNKSLIINVLSNSTESDLKKQIKLKSYNNSILQK